MVVQRYSQDGGVKEFTLDLRAIYSFPQVVRSLLGGKLVISRVTVEAPKVGNPIASILNSNV